MCTLPFDNLTRQRNLLSIEQMWWQILQSNIQIQIQLRIQIQRLLTRTWVGSDQGVLFLERGGRYIRQHWQRKEVWGINNHTAMENKEKSQNIAQTSFQLESGMGRNACSMKGDKFSCTMTVWITSYNYCFSQWIANGGGRYSKRSSRTLKYWRKNY